jgi:hypothetical protein
MWIGFGAWILYTEAKGRGRMHAISKIEFQRGGFSGSEEASRWRLGEVFSAFPEFAPYTVLE